MANEEHLAILRQGVDVWNAWRKANPDVVPNLSGAELSRAELSGTELSRANLIEANLSEAHLRETYLRGADLSRANLSRADLSEAHLKEAILYGTIFANNDLSTIIGLDRVSFFGPSHISTDTLILSKGKIPESFLRSCGVPEPFIEYLPALLGAMQPIEFYSCFISYSTKDEAFAKRLHSKMRENNLRVWFANEDLKAVTSSTNRSMKPSACTTSSSSYYRRKVCAASG
jgi:hypothetical protein